MSEAVSGHEEIASLLTVARNDTGRFEMFLVIWEFRVRDGYTEEFERLYGPDGEWSKLFREGEGWRGTELWRDESLPRRYITLDRWESAEAYRQFKRDFRQAYEALDARCESLTEAEKEIGGFLSG